MKRYLIFSLVLLQGMVFTGCEQQKEGNVTEQQEGDLDETDVFMIPLDSSGPADERLLERFEKESEEEE